jgi:hypothetical protein
MENKDKATISNFLNCKNDTIYKIDDCFDTQTYVDDYKHKIKSSEDDFGKKLSQNNEMFKNEEIQIQDNAAYLDNMMNDFKNIFIPNNLADDKASQFSTKQENFINKPNEFKPPARLNHNKENLDKQGNKNNNSHDIIETVPLCNNAALNNDFNFEMNYECELNDDPEGSFIPSTAENVSKLQQQQTFDTNESCEEEFEDVGNDEEDEYEDEECELIENVSVIREAGYKGEKNEKNELDEKEEIEKKNQLVIYLFLLLARII